MSFRLDLALPGMSGNLGVNFNDKAEVVTFFNDHNTLSAIAAGLAVLHDRVGARVDTDLVKMQMALNHALTKDAATTGPLTDNAQIEGADEVQRVVSATDGNAEFAAKVVDTTIQLIQSGEERTEEQTEGDGTPQKRKRRTKAEMEAARAAELAANADAGAVPALPATPVAPAAALPAAPAAPALPTLPPAPTLPAAPVAPVTAPPPAMLAGRVIDGIQALVDEGRTQEAMVEWIHAYGLVNAKDVPFETAMATIRLMQDAPLQKIAEALGLLDD